MAYERVNGQWPETLPPLTGQEAISAARRLYRFGLKRAIRKPFKLTSGRRYTWPRRGVYYVNPVGHYFGGWRDLVHDISHFCHRQNRGHMPGYRPHDSHHHWLEHDMVEYVIKSGWLDGKLRREPKAKPKAKPPRDAVVERHARVLARIATWETKRKRAENALRKLRRQCGYYARKMATREAGLPQPATAE